VHDLLIAVAASAFGVLFLLAGRWGALRPIWLEFRDLLVVVTPYVAFSLVALRVAQGPAAQPAFFRAAATVIATLVLALSLQARFFARPR
jgi:hypothetical protein